MKERPILFKAEMVRAILAGTKTQTRRIVKVQPGDAHIMRYCAGDLAARQIGACRWEGVRVPQGGPGDRLRVKENAWMWCEKRPNGKTEKGRQKFHYVPLKSAPVRYCVDHPTKPDVDVVSPDTGNVWLWRNKLGRFLPAWASRITLEITAVRVERLTDISASDCLSEGITPPWVDRPHLGTDVTAREIIRGLYRDLWESINGAGSWAANPWVWVIEFRKVT